MDKLKVLFGLITFRGTYVLIGAFLIELTLGTIYTLGNINSYLASYERSHVDSSYSYEWIIYIHCASLIGQGSAMIAGGYVAKVISIRSTCILGCIVHSMSTMATAWTLKFGLIGPLLSLGFMTGAGCGLVYLNLVANVLDWFPNRRGLVGGMVLSGFGLGTFIFNMAQTTFVNPNNLSPSLEDDGYFTQPEVLERVPSLFIFLGFLFAAFQFVGCCLQFKPPAKEKSIDGLEVATAPSAVPFSESIRTREFVTMFMAYLVTSQGVIFVNSLLKEFAQLFIQDDLFLAMVGSLGSLSNSLNRVIWGIAYDRWGFGVCFTSITALFGLLLCVSPFEFVLASKPIYLLASLGLLGLFGGWKAIFPIHLSLLFGNAQTTMNFGAMLLSQAVVGIGTGLVAHYAIHAYSRFVVFYFVAFLQLLGILIHHLFYPTSSSAAKTNKT